MKQEKMKTFHKVRYTYNYIILTNNTEWKNIGRLTTKKPKDHLTKDTYIHEYFCQKTLAFSLLTCSFGYITGSIFVFCFLASPGFQPLDCS